MEATQATVLALYDRLDGEVEECSLVRQRLAILGAGEVGDRVAAIPRDERERIGTTLVQKSA
ncbi:hypothetical protein GBZ48_23460 [Azospirillum melinis]|uniref:Uncharacterized protein n=1 Tax=Azospirillum melinis TaxID=328839 RepID=A0ABX2KLR6_9PROT|nr:hypothetical protein [Azospirillum melinis]MBP2306999.1 uncharacterized small protein (DUF1192 family) [Azospirillum melinis]NUB02204.1 hypothetical protein [Azospirillum melinis]